jgi:hypothetical protein
MLVKMISSVSGKEHEMDIPADPLKLLRWVKGDIDEHVQDYFPELNADQREFLITGITPDEWDEIFKDEEDEEVLEENR